MRVGYPMPNMRSYSGPLWPQQNVGQKGRNRFPSDGFEPYDGYHRVAGYVRNGGRQSENHDGYNLNVFPSGYSAQSQQLPGARGSSVWEQSIGYRPIVGSHQTVHRNTRKYQQSGTTTSEKQVPQFQTKGILGNGGHEAKILHMSKESGNSKGKITPRSNATSHLIDDCAATFPLRGY